MAYPKDIYETAFRLVSEIQFEDGAGVGGDWAAMKSVDRIASALLRERRKAKKEKTDAA